MSGISRKGFTLVEIIASLGVISLLGVLVSGTLSRQQRLFRATSEQIEVRRSVRDAVAILAEEIRGASARDTVRLMSDSAIELLTSLGSSVVCSSPGASDIALAPTSSGLSLTSWLAVPDTGDLALIYLSASSTPGIWQRYRILAATPRSTSSSCPAETGFTSGSGVSGSSYVFTLSPMPPSALPAGSPVRFVRRGRYSLYRSSDGRWYLGYRRCNAIGASSCGAIQPVSGYYRPYSADTSRTGLFFRYIDGAGQAMGQGANPLQLARVQIIAHALSAVAVTLDGKAKTAADSTSAVAALRNAP